MRAIGVRGIAQAQHLVIDEQATIAVFGKPGEAVDVGDLKSGALERLDQRIAQPLRQLVQRHEAGGRIIRLDRRMTPAIAERDAGESSRDGQIGPSWFSTADRIAGAGMAPLIACAAI